MLEIQSEDIVFRRLTDIVESELFSYSDLRTRPGVYVSTYWSASDKDTFRLIVTTDRKAYIIDPNYKKVQSVINLDDLSENHVKCWIPVDEKWEVFERKL
jgi:hypothetical protein